MNATVHIGRFLSALVATYALAGGALAQINKCQTGGKTIYQATPCDGHVVASKSVESKAAMGLPWTSLRSGMTVQEVQRAVPSVKMEKDRDNNLRIKSVSIAGHSYEDAYFAFKAEKFLQFHASSGFGSSGIGLTNSQAKSIFERTVDDLRRQLGQESSLSVTENSRMLSADAEWRLAGGRVSVSVSPITALTSQLLINYFVAP